METFQIVQDEFPMDELYAALSELSQKHKYQIDASSIDRETLNTAKFSVRKGFKVVLIRIIWREFYSNHNRYGFFRNEIYQGDIIGQSGIVRAILGSFS